MKVTFIKCEKGKESISEKSQAKIFLCRFNGSLKFYEGLVKPTIPARKDASRSDIDRIVNHIKQMKKYIMMSINDQIKYLIALSIFSMAFSTMMQRHPLSYE